MKSLLAADIKPGYITVDGIVLEVTNTDDRSIIRHRNVVYEQAPDTTVQIFGRVPLTLVRAIREAMRGEAS